MAVRSWGEWLGVEDHHFESYQLLNLQELMILVSQTTAFSKQPRKLFESQMTTLLSQAKLLILEATSMINYDFLPPRETLRSKISIRFPALDKNTLQFLKKISFYFEFFERRLK